MRQNIFGPNHSDVAKSLSSMGKLYFQMVVLSFCIWR